MGRAEKRRSERIDRLETRRGKLLMAHSEVVESKKKASKEASAFATEALMTCFALVEHDIFGFDEEKILLSLGKIDEMMGYILTGEMTIDDLKERLLEETGVKICC